MATQPAPGTRLGQFELIEYVGGGGMGRVYRAMDTSLGRLVALKVLSREQAADPETLLRFRNEARSAARLNHDGIVQVYYVGEEDGLPFIAFEFVEGVNIRTLVEQKGRLSLAEAVSYTLQVAEALAHAAQRNVVHRDIKPSNILVTADGRAKLIDMGLARLQTADNPAADLTASGVTLGTFDYISPEQARDPRAADVRSDIYSLGCTFFYMLAGRPPFPEGNVLQKLLQHQGEEPPDVRQLRPDLPEEAWRVLRKMMAKDPRRRYQDPSKLIMALLVLAELAGLQRVGPGQTVWVAPKQPDVGFLERHLPWLAPVLALGCIVFLLHMLWSSSPMRGDQASAPPTGTAAVDASGGTGPDDVLLPAEDVCEAEPKPAAPPGSPPAPPSAAGATVTEVAKPLAKPAVQASPSPFGASGSSVAVSTPASKQPADVARTAGTVPQSTPASATALSGRLGPEAIEGQLSLLGGLSASLATQATATSSSQAAGATSVAKPEAPAEGPAPSEQADVLVLGANGQPTARFPGLGPACSAARSGDVIELRYQGRRQEKPFTLTARQVSIRAGKGFQPVVCFRPTEVDPIRYSRSMITLGGDRLSVSGVSFELDVPREVPADSWSLFQLGEGQQVDLERCALTVRNASSQQTAYHPDVAFFRLRSAPATDGMRPSPSAAALRAAITMADSLARGEGVFVRVEEPRPMALTLNNVLLVTTEQLLVAEGSERSPQAEETMQIELRQATAVVRSGLCRLEHNEFASHPWPVQIRAVASILMVSPANPLVEQLGVSDVAEALARITWSGAHNYYEGFTVFWSVRQLSPDAPAKVMTFDDWQAYWQAERESMPNWNLVQWQQLPEATRPVHRHVPADYALRARSHAASAGAENEREPGVQPDRLPALPPEPD